MSMGVGVGLAGLGAAAQGYGSYRGAGANKKAAKNAFLMQWLQREAAKRKSEELYGDYLPAGKIGMGSLQRQDDILMKGDMSGFEESPGYLFRLQEGQKAIERGQASKGGLLGGGATRELSRYGQGMASQEFGNYMGQLQNLTSQGIDIGMSAAGNIQQAYTPGDFAPLIANIGQASVDRVSSPWQSGGELSSMLGSQIMQEGAQNKMMDMLMGGGGGGGSTLGSGSNAPSSYGTGGVS